MASETAQRTALKSPNLNGINYCLKKKGIGMDQPVATQHPDAKVRGHEQAERLAQKHLVNIDIIGYHAFSNQKWARLQQRHVENALAQRPNAPRATPFTSWRSEGFYQ